MVDTTVTGQVYASMSFEFRILGPVGLGCDGEAVPLGPPKRRAMVAALLLEANRPVPLGLLTRAMWPEPLPRSAVANLRNHVSALRQLVGPRLLARPRAYQLQVEEAELDASEFDRLARAGQTALTGGDPVSALPKLGQALDLWRGTAGDGLPRGTSLDQRLGALDEQRLDVFEDHVEARLHTRQLAGIAGDLRRHLTAWPVRERPWELLVLALYRSGDAAGALVAYAQARAALAGELGIEPGPRLQRLQRAVLHRDRWLDGDPAPRASVTLAAPAGPAPEAAARPLLSESRLAGEAPIGREVERAALVAALRQHPDVVVVAGPAGAGKTTLATWAAATVADEFPDGQVVVDLAGGDDAPAGPVAALGAVRQALAGGEPAGPPATAGELAADCHSLLEGRRVLLLLDGAASAGAVQPLLEPAGGATLLVTARRRRLALAGARHVEVGPLRPGAAREVLTRYAGAVRAGSEPDAVRELVQLCSGLPLALRIAGEWLASRPGLPVGVLASHLARRPLDGLRSGELSVRDALAADLGVVAAEDPLAAGAFPLLGRGDECSLEGLAGELGEDPSRVFFALERLVDRWLAESPRPGCYRAVGLARVYAAELPGG